MTLPPKEGRDLGSCQQVPMFGQGFTNCFACLRSRSACCLITFQKFQKPRVKLEAEFGEYLFDPVMFRGGESAV